MTDNNAAFAAEPAQPTATEQIADQAAEESRNSWETDAEPDPSVVRGLIWALILAMLAGVLYILPILIFNTYFPYLAALIGVAAAFGFTGFGDVKGLGIGVLSAAVAAVGTVFALLVEPAVNLARNGGRNFFEAVVESFTNAPLTLEVFFEQGPIAWIIFGASIIAGFYFASGLRQEASEEDAA